MKLCGVVILYFPADNVVDNIKTYYHNVDLLIVIDNSPNLSSFIKEFGAKNSKIKLLHDGNNEGIAKRLNEALFIASDLGFNYLLTMDQDSYFGIGEFKHYFCSFLEFCRPPEIIFAMVGVEFEKAKKCEEDNICKEVEHLITSGSIVNIKYAKEIGGFDERLFIDEVDTEFCYRAITNNFNIYKFENVFMNHQIGELDDFKSIKNFKTSKRSLHSPIRVYYLVRNYFYVSRKYSKSFFIDRKRVRKFVFISLKNNLLYNTNRFKVFYYMLAGYYHFLRNKMYKKV